MSSRPNQLLMGAILLMIGIVSLISPNISFGLTSITLLAGGSAFLLLYRTKRKTWSLILGVCMLCFGLVNFIGSQMGSYFSLNASGAMFFIIPAIIFLILYFDKNKRGLLLPACLMLWFGIFVFLKGFYAFENNTSALLLCCLGLGFLTLYFLGRRVYGKWPLYLSIGLEALCAVIFLFGAPYTAPVFDTLTQIASACLVAVSVIIILRALRRKP